MCTNACERRPGWTCRTPKHARCHTHAGCAPTNPRTPRTPHAHQPAYAPHAASPPTHGTLQTPTNPHTPTKHTATQKSALARTHTNACSLSVLAPFTRPSHACARSHLPTTYSPSYTRTCAQTHMEVLSHSHTHPGVQGHAARAPALRMAKGGAGQPLSRTHRPLSHTDGPLSLTRSVPPVTLSLSHTHHPSLALAC